MKSINRNFKIDKLKLVIIMTKQNITVVELADKIDIARETVSAAKNGHRCSFRTVSKIAGGLGVSVNDILDDDYKIIL